jgi:hypothetical protein
MNPQDRSILYLIAFLALAQRAFCAAEILARASGDNRRFFVADLAAAFPRRTAFQVPVSMARTCSSLRI